MGLDHAFIERIVEIFPRRPLAVVLFGSFARDESTYESDIDLLIVFDRRVRLTRSLYRIFDDRLDLSRFRNQPNPHLVVLPGRRRDCGSLWFEVAIDGVVLWEDGSRVSVFLRQLREHISTGEMKRKTAYGHPYWIQSEEGR
ncbi:MAG: nucleotidyltransferase domain-containing protein [Deltaproteobacteria bacterium]|nr:nucleotidyltransferase domain-containing protein [Deltaproteobacteria bacterium]